MQKSAVSSSPKREPRKVVRFLIQAGADSKGLGLKESSRHEATRARFGWCPQDKSPNTWGPILGALQKGALLFGIYIRTPDCWKLPYMDRAILKVGVGCYVVYIYIYIHRGRGRILGLYQSRDAIRSPMITTPTGKKLGVIASQDLASKAISEPQDRQLCPYGEANASL